MSKLRFYSNDVDVVIAESKADAAKVWEENTGDKWADYEDDSEWELDEREPDAPIRIAWIDDDPTVKEVPTGGSIEERSPGGYPHVVSTAEQWIAHCGRCFFSSTEW